MQPRKEIRGMFHLVSLLVALAAAAPAVGGEEVLRTSKALDAYRNDYSGAKENKAFAQSPGGAWAWRDDRVSPQFAREDALRACNASLKKNEKPCTIVNLNGAWLSDKSVALSPMAPSRQ